MCVVHSAKVRIMTPISCVYPHRASSRAAFRALTALAAFSRYKCSTFGSRTGIRDAVFPNDTVAVRAKFQPMHGLTSLAKRSSISMSVIALRNSFLTLRHVRAEGGHQREPSYGKSNFGLRAVGRVMAGWARSHRGLSLAGIPATFIFGNRLKQSFGRVAGTNLNSQALGAH
jgi:hypothetical protein